MLGASLRPSPEDVRGAMGLGSPAAMSRAASTPRAQVGARALRPHSFSWDLTLGTKQPQQPGAQSLEERTYTVEDMVAPDER